MFKISVVTSIVLALFIALIMSIGPDLFIGYGTLRTGELLISEEKVGITETDEIVSKIKQKFALEWGEYKSLPKIYKVTSKRDSNVVHIYSLGSSPESVKKIITQEANDIIGSQGRVFDQVIAKLIENLSDYRSKLSSLSKQKNNIETYLESYFFKKRNNESLIKKSFIYNGYINQVAGISREIRSYVEMEKRALLELKFAQANRTALLGDIMVRSKFDIKKIILASVLTFLIVFVGMNLAKYILTNLKQS